MTEYFFSGGGEIVNLIGNAAVYSNAVVSCHPPSDTHILQYYRTVAKTSFSYSRLVWAWLVDLKTKLSSGYREYYIQGFAELKISAVDCRTH